MNINIKKVDKDKIAAWAVHGFTASGAVLGFLAIMELLLEKSELVIRLQTLMDQCWTI